MSTRKQNAVRSEKIFLKQKDIPSISKNIPKYIGFLVFEKIPSVMRDEDCSIFKVVLCFLNKSRAFPIITNPKKATRIPERLSGKGM